MSYRPHERVQKSFHKPSLTKQSFAPECNINNIMARYLADGLIEHVNEHKGHYDDLPDEVGYHESLNTVMAAQDAFNSLTSKIRTQFDNDPAKFMAFVSDPENQDEIDALGLGEKSFTSTIPSGDEEPEMAPIPEPELTPLDAG